jgi:hypothetical protein
VRNTLILGGVGFSRGHVLFDYFHHLPKVGLRRAHFLAARPIELSRQQAHFLTQKLVLDPLGLERLDLFLAFFELGRLLLDDL